MLLDVARPILDGADGRDRLDHRQQRVARIALAGGERILEHDERQARGICNAFEVLYRHGWALAQRERRRRKDEQRRRAALIGHAGDAGGFEAAVRPYAVDDRQPIPDFVLRDVEHAALLLETARSDLGGMALTVIAVSPSTPATSV